MSLELHILFFFFQFQQLIFQMTKLWLESDYNSIITLQTASSGVSENILYNLIWINAPHKEDFKDLYKDA